MKKNNSTIKNTFLTLILSMACICAQAQWDTVGVAGFTGNMTEHFNLAVYKGVPYFAGTDGVYAKSTPSAGRIKVMKFENGQWVNVGTPGFSSNYIYEPKLQWHDGKLIVAYAEAGPSPSFVPILKIKKHNGSTWEDLGTSIFTTSIYNNRFDITLLNDTLYLANLTTLYKYNGTAWVKVSDYGQSLADVALDVYDNVLYLASMSNAQTQIMKYMNGKWENVGNPTPYSTSGKNFKIKGGIPYIISSDDQSTYKISLWKLNGNAWEKVGNQDISNSRTSINSLIFVGQTPYVCYSEVYTGNKASVKKFSGTAWENVGINGATFGSTGFNSFALDENTLYLGFQDRTAGILGTVLKLKVGNILSVEASNKNEIFSIFPNPTIDKLFINSNSDYTIFNSLGIEVSKGMVSGNSIDVYHLDNGVYHLQLSDKGTNQRLKFIKQ